MIVDCHCHIASRKALPEKFFEGWSRTIKGSLPFKRSPLQEQRIDELLSQLNEDPECTNLIREMEDAGIDKAILLLIDFGLVFKEVGVTLEELHLEHMRLASASDKFITFSGVDPRRGKEGLDLFEKAVGEWGFRGLKVYPPCGFSPSDKMMFPFYEICGERKLPVFTHVGPTTSSLPFKHTRPMDVDDAAFGFPGVNFILGHAGVVWYEEAALLAQYRPNVYLDLSGFQVEAGRGYFKGILRWLVSRGMGKKLLFGTDWPIHRFGGTQSKWVKEIQSCLSEGVITEDDAENIFFNNANDILRLSA
jgi:uncharacterized protein